MLKLTKRENDREQEKYREKREIGYITCDLQQAMEAVRPENRQKSRRGILRVIPSGCECLSLRGRELTLCSPFHQHIHTRSYTFRLFSRVHTQNENSIHSSVTCNCYISCLVTFAGSEQRCIYLMLCSFPCQHGFPLILRFLLTSKKTWQQVDELR